ncbi:MAG: right-handed parallel beta-helix repeat-containing protein, partial [Anaerovoracaceae bacterium]
MKKLFAILLSLAMLVCFMPTMAFAGEGMPPVKTVYVNAAATGTADGTTEATGYRTVEAAITAAATAAGDTIKVVGTYSEPVNATGITKNIIIDGGGTAVFTQPLKLTSASSNITVKGLKFENVKVEGKLDKDAAIDISTVGKVEVSNNTISGVTSESKAKSTGMGIRVIGATNVNVNSNTISNVTHNGINIYGGAPNVILVVYNTITDWGQNQQTYIQGRAIRVDATGDAETQVAISTNIMSNKISPTDKNLSDRDFYLKLTSARADTLALTNNYWGSAKPDWVDTDESKLNTAAAIVSISPSDGGALSGVKAELFPFLKYESGLYSVNNDKSVIYNSSDARTINVDGTKGDNATADGSALAPFKTIDAAIEATKTVGNQETSDVIKVGAGTYTDAVDVVDIARPLTVEGVGAVLTQPLNLTSTDSNITVKGLKVENVIVVGPPDKVAAIDIFTKGDVVVSGNIISGVAGNSTGMGLRIRNAATVEVNGNTISNVTHNGINIFQGTLTSIKVINNTITNWGQNQDAKIQGRAIRVAATPSTSNQIEISSNIMSNTILQEEPKLDDKDFYLKLTNVGTGITRLDLSHNYWGIKTPNWLTGALAKKGSIVTATSDGGDTALVGAKAKLFPFYQDASKYYLQDEQDKVTYVGPSTPTPPTPEKPKEEVVTQPDG